MSGLRATMKNVVLDMTKVSGEEQQRYATEFSEGNEDLKKVLLYMWGNGINTFTCCAGHAPERQNGGVYTNEPYIMFDMSSLKSKEVKDILSKLILLNETEDKPCLSIDFISQLLDAECFMKSVAEGHIEDDVFERHSIMINFIDGDSAHYKELLNILQSVKSKDKSLINILKEKFKKVTKIDTNFTGFVEAVSKVNEISLKDKAGDEDFYSIHRILLSYQKGELYQGIETKRPKDYVVFQDERGKVFECAPGYLISVESEYPWLPDKFFTIKDGEAVEITPKEAQRLKLYQVNNELEYHGDFSATKMKEVLEGLNQEQTLAQL